MFSRSEGEGARDKNEIGKTPHNIEQNGSQMLEAYPVEKKHRGERVRCVCTGKTGIFNNCVPKNEVKSGGANMSTSVGGIWMSRLYVSRYIYEGVCV